MIKGQLIEGKAGAEKVIDVHLGILTMLLTAKCTAISSEIIMNKADNSKHPDLLWTTPDGVSAVDTDVLQDKAYEFYTGFVKSGKAFKDIYGTVIELVNYVDQITVEEC